MKTISNSEFLANPEMWLDEAREQDVCVKKGNAMFHIIYKADDEPTDEQTERALAAWLRREGDCAVGHSRGTVERNRRGFGQEMGRTAEKMKVQFTPELRPESLHRAPGRK